jgi:hypothetical protein
METSASFEARSAPLPYPTVALGEAWRDLPEGRLGTSLTIGDYTLMWTSFRTDVARNVAGAGYFQKAKTLWQSAAQGGDPGYRRTTALDDNGTAPISFVSKAE